MAGVRTWIDGDVAHLRLDEPERLNPLGPAQWIELREYLALAESTAGVRAVVLDATGRYFCAGNDLRAVGALSDDEAALEYFVHTQLPTLRALVASPLPVVCVIQADCAGGGLELALACDVVIAADAVRVSLPEPRVGLFATTVLAAAPAALSRHALQRLAYTGEQVDAATAQQLGLVHQVVGSEELDDAVESTLRRVRLASPAALAATKATINAPLLTEGFPRMQAALEKLASEILFSGEAREGLRAFRERRAPVWGEPGVG